MLEKDDIRVQQAQEEKLKKTKRLIWKLFKWIVAISKVVYRIWRSLEGDLEN